MECAVGRGRSPREEHRAAARHPAGIRRRMSVRAGQGPARRARRRQLGTVRDLVGIALELGVLAAARLFRLAFQGRRRNLPDGETAAGARGIPADEQPGPVRRHLRRQRAAGQTLPELSLGEPGLLHASLLCERAHRQLGAEAAVEGLRRIAEDALERRRETAAARGSHALPEARQGLPAVAVGEPLEIRRADEVRDRAAEPALGAVQIVVVRQPALDRELAQHHRAEARARPARPGQRSLDDRGVALGHPLGRRERERTERRRRQQYEHGRRAVARAREVDDVRDLVRRHELHPVAVVANGRLRLGRRGPQQDLGPVEKGDGGSVRVRKGIGDDDLDPARRDVSHVVGHPRVDRLDLASGVERPGREGRRIVDPEVRRLDGPPLGRRALRRGRPAGE